MQLIISGRNVDVSDDLRERIEEQFARLARYDSRASRAEITLWEENDLSRIEAVLSIDRRPQMHAEAEADAFRTALDRLTARLARRLKKEGSRRRARRKSTVEAPAEEPPADEAPFDDAPFDEARPDDEESSA